jgi:hypothetical protein
LKNVRFLWCSSTSQCFSTSIWDETLYKAWSEIVTNLIPNISLWKHTQQLLSDFAMPMKSSCLSEQPFLVIAHAQAADPYATPAVGNGAAGGVPTSVTANNGDGGGGGAVENKTALSTITGGRL